MTLLDLLTSSLRTIGVKNPGVNLTADEVEDAKEILNLLLDAWSAEVGMVYASVREGLTLVVGTSSYTIGTGGTFDTDRPTQILNAYVQTGGIDYPMEIIGPNKYQGMALKTTAGRPYWLNYVLSAPLGTIYLYPTPDAAETLYLDSLKALSEMTTLTATIALPPGYEAGLISNLAVALAPEYNREPSQITLKQAHDTKKAIMNLNAASRLEPVNLGYGYYQGYSRSILEG